MRQPIPTTKEELEEALGYIEAALDTAEPWGDETWESLYSSMGILEDYGCDGSEWAAEIAWSLRLFVYHGEPVSDLRSIAEALRLQLLTVRG